MKRKIINIELIKKEKLYITYNINFLYENNPFNTIPHRTILTLYKENDKNNILILPNASSIFNIWKESILDILKLHSNKYLLVDIKQIYNHYFNFLKNHCTIIFENNYTSTNNSEMKLIMFDLSNLK